MNPFRRPAVLPLALAATIAMSACGSESDSSADAAPETTPDVTVAEEDVAPDTAVVTTEATAADEDHADEDHADEDHADEDHADEDHADEDHGDEDHADEDHGDEDHADEDQGDEDHEDHGDEDHDDHDDHGDEDHEDHDDEDHDDHDHDDEESGGLGAHEHGAAEMSVAWIGADVSIDLISPTFNVFGFEYEPTTDEDIAIEADRTEALTADGIIALDDAAGCTLADPVETEVEREGSHAEITVSWQFSCDDPDAIEQLDASGLFAEFPNLEDVDAQWVSDSDQSAAELTPSSTTLALRL